MKAHVSGYPSDPLETMKAPSPSLLTACERQIVTLLLEGCTNRTIAARLGITDQTVKNQLSTLYQKVGVGSRLELVLVAMRSDLG
jgi:DNA-binding NarL/FixJ family response regulator